jgi:hypothetical protein
VNAEDVVDVATAILKGSAHKKPRERRKGRALLVKALEILESPIQALLRDNKALGEVKIQELGGILLTIGQTACQHENWGEFLASVHSRD